MLTKAIYNHYSWGLIVSLGPVSYVSRPIVSAFSCLTELISSNLDKIMAPIIKTSYIKDSQLALEIFRDFFSLARTNFFSLDNINLFCCLTAKSLDVDRHVSTAYCKFSSGNGVDWFRHSIMYHGGLLRVHFSDFSRHQNFN